MLMTLSRRTAFAASSGLMALVMALQTLTSAGIADQATSKGPTGWRGSCVLLLQSDPRDAADQALCGSTISVSAVGVLLAIAVAATRLILHRRGIPVPAMLGVVLVTAGAVMTTASAMASAALTMGLVHACDYGARLAPSMSCAATIQSMHSTTFATIVAAIVASWIATAAWCMWIAIELCELHAPYNPGFAAWGAQKISSSPRVGVSSSKLMTRTASIELSPLIEPPVVVAVGGTQH